MEQIRKFFQQVSLTLTRKQSSRQLFINDNNSIFVSFFMSCFQLLLLVGLCLTVIFSKIEDYRGYPISTTFTYFLILLIITIMFQCLLSQFNKNIIGFYLDVTLFCLSSIYFITYMFGYSMFYIIILSIFYIVGITRVIFGIVYELSQAKQTKEGQRLI